MGVLKYISVKEVVSKIYRDLNLQQEDRWVDMIEWCGEALQKIGAHPQYVEKVEEIEVSSYRGLLPCDIHKIIQISYNNTPLIASHGSFDGTNQKTNLKSNNTTSYTINDAYIQTNFEQGTIYMSYIGVPTDQEGFPLVPDDEGYKEAMLKYVVLKLKYPEYIAGTLQPNFYKMLEQEWHRYCAQARGNANMPSIDEMESIKNQWVRLLPRLQEHKKFFNTTNSRERIAGNSLPNINNH